jgi:hypothetical protein
MKPAQPQLPQTAVKKSIFGEKKDLNDS